MQLQFSLANTGASISFEKCVGHRGMMKLLTTPPLSVKALKCTNCSSCKDCKQPVPLTIPQDIGGSGCRAEVAAKAEALAVSKTSASRSSAAGTQHKISKGGAGGGDQATGAGTAASDTPVPSNTALVECAVCHRKPGDPGVPATLKLCGGCHSIRYCSTDCQRKDWKLGHKTLCQVWATGSKPS
jgi:hypothetical protein